MGSTFGWYYIVKLLLARNEIQVNIQDNKGDTALHKSIQNELKTTSKNLVKHKNIKLNIFNNKGETPLEIAVKKEFIKVIRLLLDAGAKLTTAVYEVASDELRLAFAIHQVGTTLSWRKLALSKLKLPKDVRDTIARRSLQTELCEKPEFGNWDLATLRALAHIMLMKNVAHLSRKELCDEMSDVLKHGGVYQRERNYKPLFVK